MAHKIYRAILAALHNGTLKEPFTAKDFQEFCPGFGTGTYKAFLWKHSEGNSKGESELFEKVGRGLFRLIRPFKYGLQD